MTYRLAFCLESKFFNILVVFLDLPGLSICYLRKNRVPKRDVTKILFLEYCNFGLKF